MDKKQFYSKILDKYIVDKVYYNDSKLPIEIVLGVINKESRFEQMALNKNWNKKRTKIISYDIGLFQLNSKVYSKHTHAELFNIDKNIEFGIKHLNNCYAYTKDIESAIELYHLGHGNVYHKKLSDNQYVFDVIKYAGYLECLYVNYLFERKLDL